MAPPGQTAAVIALADIRAPAVGRGQGGSRASICRDDIGDICLCGLRRAGFLCWHLRGRDLMAGFLPSVVRRVDHRERPDFTEGS
jgi:hypothetical protein